MCYKNDSILQRLFPEISNIVSERVAVGKKYIYFSFLDWHILVWEMHSAFIAAGNFHTLLSNHFIMPLLLKNNHCVPSFLLSIWPFCPEQLYNKVHSGWHLSTWITAPISLWIHHLMHYYLLQISQHVILLKYKWKRKKKLHKKKNLMTIYKINVSQGFISVCLMLWILLLISCKN